jgi:hypothetical protein
MPAILLGGCKKRRKMSFQTNVQFEVKDAAKFLKGEKTTLFSEAIFCFSNREVSGAIIIMPHFFQRAMLPRKPA